MFIGLVRPADMLANTIRFTPQSELNPLPSVLIANSAYGDK